MNVSTYFSCLSGFGTNTGSFLGVYDFSGDSKILFNEIYTSSNQYINNVPNSNNYPLISLYGSATGTGFYGNTIYQIGNNISGNFSILMQINYNSCSRNTTGIDEVLLSTSPNYSGILSGIGFFLGLNESNRIYVESSGINSILNYELKSNNFIYLSFNQQVINYGIYDILNNNLNLQTINLNSSNNLNTIYLGNFLNDVESTHTGFNGSINFMSFINQSLVNSDLLNCIDCFFITGIQITGTGSNTYQLPIIQGYTGITNIYTGITGYAYISGNITNSSGTNTPIYISSGLTGLITGNIFSNLITGTTNLIISGNPLLSYIYNTGLYNSFINYNLNFNLSLMSGDYVEIYTYNSFNSFINNSFDSLNDYPDTNLYLEIFDNGLLQTSGIDWGLNVQNEITGGFNNTDFLGYDLTVGIPIVTAYSGLWSASKVLLSGGSYFPPNSQYIESGNAVIVTGINNTQINSNTDLYLNGQKIISGLQYSFITSGSIPNVLILSGNLLPYFDYTALYAPTGGLPTGVTNIQSNDLILYPRENNPNYYLFNITGNINSINNVIGFNPCIYINGIKQTNNFDFVINYGCSLASGYVSTFYPFTFFNNDTTFLNVS